MGATARVVEGEGAGGPGAAALARWLPWLIGLAAALALVPLGYLDGSAERLRQPSGDLRQHLVALQAYLADDWHWPPLLTLRLGWPDGANLIYADVIPGLALLAKAVHDLTGVSVGYFGPWIFADFLLQPVAAGVLLRSLGLRSPLAIAAGCLLALALPAFLARTVHPVLQAHWLLLLALTLALKTARDPRPLRWLGWLAALALTLLLVNAYLFAMAAALALAALAEAVRRRALRWQRAALLALLWAGLALGLMALLGYFAGTGSSWGFGRYSMNLLSPFVPQYSALLPGTAEWLLGPPPGRAPGWAIDVIDANGSQWHEGYNYLGLGLLLLLALVATLACSRLPGAFRRQPFVIGACLAMALFALSHKVWVGYALVLDLPEPPRLLRQFRSTGRFFWPLAYLLLAGGCLLLWRARPRLAPALLSLLALLQLADVRLLIERTYATLRDTHEAVLAPAVWAPLIAAHERVRIYPTNSCWGDWQRLLMEVVSLAVAQGRPVNTMYLSRPPVKDCRIEAAERAGLPPDPAELAVLFDAVRDEPAPPPSAELAPHCRRFVAGLVCTPRWGSLPPEVEAAFPPDGAPP